MDRGDKSQTWDSGGARRAHFVSPKAPAARSAASLPSS
jgi:hypothetical protein